MFIDIYVNLQMGYQRSWLKILFWNTPLAKYLTNDKHSASLDEFLKIYQSSWWITQWFFRSCIKDTQYLKLFDESILHSSSDMMTRAIPKPPQPHHSYQVIIDSVMQKLAHALSDYLEKPHSKQFHFTTSQPLLWKLSEFSFWSNRNSSPENRHQFDQQYGIVPFSGKN